jgi:MFS family permease
VGLIATLRRIPLYVLVGLLTFAAIGFPMAILKLFALDQFGLTSAQFGLAVLPGALLLAVASGPVAAWGGRLGPLPSVRLGLGLCALGMGWAALGAFAEPWRNVAMLVPGVAALGAGFLLAIPGWLAAVAALDPARRAANLGAVMGAQGVGAILGAALGGRMYEAGSAETLGRYGPFLACAGLLGVAWVLVLRLPAVRRADP